MGGVCSEYGVEERRIRGLCGDVNWIELAQDRDKWRSLVTVVMNLRVP